MPGHDDRANSDISRVRRSEHARGEAWIADFLARAEVGHVATRWDDQPFVTPTTFWYDAGAHRIAFHSSLAGRLRANIERHPLVCLEASTFGRFLPSNAALELSVQYASVAVFGRAAVVADPAEKRRLLDGLARKYFPGLVPGREVRPITDAELNATCVYALTIESWSGKENWPEQADQTDAWPPLPGELL